MEFEKHKKSPPRSLARDLFAPSEEELEVEAKLKESLEKAKSTGPANALQRFQPLLKDLKFEETGAATKPAVSLEDLKAVQEGLKGIERQVEEISKASLSKFKELEEQIERLELLQEQQREEIAIRYIEIKERQNSSEKIANLIDRHNQLVNSFEGRLQELKRNLNEREMSFLQVKASLEDAQAEISRLKRER